MCILKKIVLTVKNSIWPGNKVCQGQALHVPTVGREIVSIYMHHTGTVCSHLFIIV